MMPAWTGPTGTWNTPSPFHLAELMALALKRRQHGRQVEIFAQRVHLRPVIVQGAAAGIGMAFELEAEQVLNFALLPIGGGQGIGQGHELRLVRLTPARAG